jgi:hypothetical protein
MKAKIDTIFILDAPILLDMLGFGGPSRKMSIDGCLKILRERGGRVATLGHCLEEMTDIFNEILEQPGPQRHGLIGDALRSNPALAERARQVAGEPGKAVKAANVDVLLFDRNSPMNQGHFPDALIDRFAQCAAWRGQAEQMQRYRDAWSVACIMRRRQNDHSHDVFQSKFVMLTRNGTFAEFSRAFVRANLGVPASACGPVVDTKTLAASVWMRFGSAEYSDLPRTYLMCACDRILATDGDLLSRAARKLSQLEGQEIAAALLSSERAVLDLVVSTGGSADVLDGANNKELILALAASAEERGRREERS